MLNRGFWPGVKRNLIDIVGIDYRVEERVQVVEQVDHFERCRRGWKHESAVLKTAEISALADRWRHELSLLDMADLEGFWSESQKSQNWPEIDVKPHMSEK